MLFIGTGPADYGGWLGTVGDEQALEPIVRQIAEAKVDLIDLHQLREPHARQIAQALGARYNVFKLPQEPTLVVETGGDFDMYLSRLSKKFRKNTIYADRRLRRDFRYEERTVQAGSELDGQMDRFFDLHQSRWLSKRLPGLFLGQGNRRFHKELAQRLALEERLVLAVTYIDDKPVAAFYGFKFGRDYSYYLGGFDPEWSKYSVSSVLIHNLIKEACGAGFTGFDFLRGQESYKLRWLAQEVPLFRVVACRSGPLGRLGAALAKTENELMQRARARLHN